MRYTRGPVAIALMSTVLLAGCAASTSDPGSSDSGESSATTSPSDSGGTPTAEPTEEPAVSAPIFEGSCDELLSSMDLGSMELGDVEHVDTDAAYYAPTLTGGGLPCIFENATFRLDVLLHPEGAVTDEVTSEWDEPFCGVMTEGTSGCRVTSTANGSWIAVTLSSTGIEDADAVDIDGAVEAFQADGVVYATDGTNVMTVTTGADGDDIEAIPAQVLAVLNG